MTDYFLEEVKTIKKKLDSVSSSFCLAKWYQVTVHLQNGHTHSCHHPGTHKVPLDELTNNPTALHNTQFKKERRKEMLEGTRPTECQYCWNVEDSPGENFSDRHIKSAAMWSAPWFDGAASKPWDDNPNPRYLEVSFGNVCNFKCMYCYPNISSQWYEESKQYGPYPTSLGFGSLEHLDYKGTRPILEREYNPYVEAFWKWWPDLYNSLHTFRITGGEPLLNKNTFRVLNEINDNPRQELELAINTNMCVPDKNFNEFISLIKPITEKLDNVGVFTSIEATHKKAEWIRYGLEYNKFWENIARLQNEVPKLHIDFMCTYNALSVSSFTDFLKKIYELRCKSSWDEPWHPPLMVSVPYLRNPPFLTIKILDNTFEHYIIESIDYMEAHRGDDNTPGFVSHEIEMMTRLLNWFQTIDSEQQLKVNRTDFVKYADEYDRRRNTNFLETFPEYTDFYNRCKALC